MKKEDESRTRAYGWSIPATIDTASSTTSIPVPVCCRPLLDQQPSLKVKIRLQSTVSKMFSDLVCYRHTVAWRFEFGRRIYYWRLNFLRWSTKRHYWKDWFHDCKHPLRFFKAIFYFQASKVLEERSIWESSSLIWVGSSNEKRSYVTIFDANNSNCILECFPVLSSHLLCISSVADKIQTMFKTNKLRFQVSEKATTF